MAKRTVKAEAGEPSHHRDVTIGESGSAGLTVADVVAVAREGARVRLASAAADRVATARAYEYFGLAAPGRDQRLW